MMRERLPDRREAELVDFAHNGHCWTATVSRFPDGRVAEVFIDGPKEAPIVELAQEFSDCRVARIAGRLSPRRTAACPGRPRRRAAR